MKRYDYELQFKDTHDGFSELNFHIFDRVRGIKLEMATVYDRDDAERIINALNIQDARLQGLLSLTGAK